MTGWGEQAWKGMSVVDFSLLSQFQDKSDLAGLAAGLAEAWPWSSRSCGVCLANAFTMES